ARPAAQPLSYFVSAHDTLSDHHGYSVPPSWGNHPLLAVRPRFPDERRIATRAELDVVRLSTLDAEILRHLREVHGKKGFSAAGEAASIVLHLLHDAAIVNEEASDRAVTFARAPALLRVVRTRMQRRHVGAASGCAR